MLKFEIVSSQKSLDDFISSQRGLSCPAYMDTEFVRVTTYKPILGLVQVRVGENNYVFDPVNINNLSNLTSILENKDCVKIFHAAFQDIEVFFNEFKVIPHPIFDTQIAASFLGFGISVSYETMVEHCCGVTLDKSSQFTDWTKRPLSKDQMEYAVRDVYYLEKVYDFVVKELKAKGYYEWALGEMLALENPGNYSVNMQEIWRKAKPSSHNRPFLARLREIAKFREELALEWNRPRGRVFNDEIANKIAHKNPENLEELLKGVKLPREVVNSGELPKLINQLAEVRCMDPDKYPKLLKKQRLSDAMKNKVALVKKSLAEVSEETGIAASVIAKAKEIEDFVRSPEKDHRFLSGWRNDIFGKKAIELL